MALVDDTLKAELRTLYEGADRHYHGLSHIEELLRLVQEHRSELADPEVVEAAVWFHDAVYDSRRRDNESRSAALAAERLAGRADPERLRRIAGMIEATASHRLPRFTDAAARHDAALFLDMDLSILAAAPDVFDAYEQAVRREFGWVAETDWRSGRRAVLEAFLARRHIFHTDIFRSAGEARARENISRSLAQLGAPQAPSRLD